jgi:hypothetical protein
MDARLDAMTRQKVDNLARHFRQPRAVVVSHMMRWGLSREPGGALDQGASQGPVRHLYLYVDSDLYEAVQKAATTAGVTTAPWLRHMVRHIRLADFPASWQAEPSDERSHDSRIYGKRFMLRPLICFPRVGISTWPSATAHRPGRGGATPTMRGKRLSLFA